MHGHPNVGLTLPGTLDPLDHVDVGSCEEFHNRNKSSLSRPKNSSSSKSSSSDASLEEGNLRLFHTLLFLPCLPSAHSKLIPSTFGEFAPILSTSKLHSSLQFSFFFPKETQVVFWKILSQGHDRFSLLFPDLV